MRLVIADTGPINYLTPTDTGFAEATKIFADLEKVMPYNVRLVSVRLPEIDVNNQVLLDMVVGAKDVPPILELFKRLEGSPQFGNASVQSTAPPSQTDPYFRYHVTVTYAQKL